MTKGIPESCEDPESRECRLSRWYPRKVMHWVVIGICLVVLPLLLALASATHFMRQLSQDSQSAVLEGTQSVRYSRTLSDYLLGMERNARVYQVIGDEKLLENFRELHREFELTAANLLSSESEPAVLAQITRLLSIESKLYKVMISEPPNSTLAVNSLQHFVEMREIVRALIDRNSEGIRERVESLHQYASDAQAILFWEAFMVVPIAAALGLFIMVRITRPMRALDRNIHLLGSGDVSERMTVEGPDDIRALGERLEWLRQRLGELADQKKVFLQHISHELKTPLASIREGTSLLKGGYVGELNGGQQDIVDILEKNALQLQGRIEDLLAFSIDGETRSDLALETLRLDHLVNQVVTAHHLSIHAKHLQVEWDIEALELKADKEKLAAIIDNLISNAVKFSPEQGVVTIICKALDRSGKSDVYLDIIDCGPGINRQEQEQVFQPFFQGSAPYSGHLKGTGLGLAIARLYARLHGGDIRVVPGDRGAHLQLTLPGAEPISQTNGEESVPCTDTLD